MKRRFKTKLKRRNRFVSGEEPFPSEAQAAFQRLVTDFAFPCIGAKAALNSGAVSFGFYERLASDTSTKNLARDLESFTKARTQQSENQLATMVAVFRGPFDLDELEFEKLLWSQLQKLHRADTPRFAWDARVSSDPSAPEFSFSFAEQAYYVIGMHANSSRRARRFPWPTLVFNLHEQFERLRSDRNWERMKRTIRARDYQFQGSINPMLSDFGEESEARQYSGRAVEADWRAPFFPTVKCPFAHGKRGSERR
jgi:FPC/CPF motif-containing protein YcgG